MKITNAELMAKIAAGQILPGICKNINNIKHTNNEEIKEEKIIDENQKIIQKRLYNKTFNFNDAAKVTDDKTEDYKLANYLIKSREPNVTVLTNNELNLQFNNQLYEMLQNIERQKEIKLNNNMSNMNVSNVHFYNTPQIINNTQVEPNVQTESNIQVNKPDVKDNIEKSLPLPIKKFAYESDTDIILKGANIIMGINKCGLIGNSMTFASNLQEEINLNNVGLQYNNLEYMEPLFSRSNQK